HPEPVFVDQSGGGQRLQQLAAAPDVQYWSIRRLQPADLVDAAELPRIRPAGLVEAARHDVFGRVVERRRDGAVTGMRPIAREDFIGTAPKQHVELASDGLGNDLAAGI